MGTVGTNDPQVRAALHAHLPTVFAGQQALVVDELQLLHGLTSADVAVVTPAAVHGYEIKSARDSLARLPQQVVLYGFVCDYVTLVVATNAVDRALPRIPEWWGVIVTSVHVPVVLWERRVGTRNPDLPAIHLAGLLWRAELHALLGMLGERVPARLARAQAAQRLIACADPAWLRAHLYATLAARTDWRGRLLAPDSGKEQDDDLQSP